MTYLEREGTDGETQAVILEGWLSTPVVTQLRLSLICSRTPADPHRLGTLPKGPGASPATPRGSGTHRSLPRSRWGTHSPGPSFPSPPLVFQVSAQIWGPLPDLPVDRACAPAGCGQCRASCGVTGTRPGNSHGGHLRRRGPTRDQVLHGTRRLVTGLTPTDEDTGARGPDRPGAPGGACRAGSKASWPGACPQMLPPVPWSTDAPGARDAGRALALLVAAPVGPGGLLRSVRSGSLASW